MTVSERAAALNYVGGAWVPALSSETYEKVNPARLDEMLGPFALSDPADAASAVRSRGRRLPRLVDAAARQSRRVPVEGRGTARRPHRGDRAGHDARDGQAASRVARRGRPDGADLPLRGERGLHAGRRALEQALSGGRVSTSRRPLGVVALITPWNFPAAIPAWKLAPALVFGNTVVLKLAYEAPLSGLHLARALDDAGLPAGALNVLTGRGSNVGAALVHDDRVAAISFTGSVATGAWVRDEGIAHRKRIQLELGGQNPLLVMADADLDRAAEAAYAGAFWSAGQKCTATRRIYVEEPVCDDFKARLVARMRTGKVGDPADPAVEVGPLVNESQHAEVADAIERGIAEGARIVAGGPPLSHDGGYYVPPTLFEGVADDGLLSCEEVFGPVASLYSFEGLDEAIARANAVEMGLSAGIFTSSLASSIRFQREVQAGLIHVNSQTAGADVHVPFGGIKASGFGPHEQGRAALEFYTDLVTIYVDP